jgi:hypothetical protein
MKRLLLATIAALALAPSSAWANAEGPGTPQATAANATFLSNAPTPPSGRGVCVIDSGVDTDTDLGPALASRVAQIGGVNGDPSDLGTISDTGEPLPKHGTYVAGVIASQVDGVGTSGIWPAAKIYSNRVFAGGGVAQAADYIRGIDWCRDQPGVRVINLSLSGLTGATTSQRTNLDARIETVRGAPYYINVVAAAGNNASMSTVGYPALADGVFSVAASEASGLLSTFTNQGMGLDIAAFGSGLCVSTDRETRLAIGSGTSYATPVVSAVLAALRSYDPLLTPDQAEQLLLDHADVVNGVRVLNAAEAFRADPRVAAMASTSPVSGISAAATNACEPPPAHALNGSGGGVALGPRPDASKTSQPAAAQVPITELPAPAPLLDVQLPAKGRSGAARQAAPTLRSISFRHGMLVLRIAGSKPWSRARYHIAYRANGRIRTKVLVRKGRTLRAHVPDWISVRIRLEVRGSGMTSALTVRRNDEF